MNRSFSRFALLSLLALSATAALAQGPTTSPVAERALVTSNNLEPRAPKGYISPQDRIRAGTKVSSNSVSGKVGESIQPICKLKGCVPVIGRTADGKYPVYALQGEPGDLKYFAPQINIAYRAQDLYGRMSYVEMSDLHAPGMHCDYVCKNGAGQVVGIDPEVKKFDPTLAKK